MYLQEWVADLGERSATAFIPGSKLPAEKPEAYSADSMIEA